MMTLQDVIDAAVTCPEKYGKHGWFVNKRAVRVKPICPMAVEVMEWRRSHHRGCASSWLSTRACDPFYELVGHGQDRDAKALRALGYRVP